MLRQAVFKVGETVLESLVLVRRNRLQVRERHIVEGGRELAQLKPEEAGPAEPARRLSDRLLQVFQVLLVQGSGVAIEGPRNLRR